MRDLDELKSRVQYIKEYESKEYEECLQKVLTFYSNNRDNIIKCFEDDVIKRLRYNSKYLDLSRYDIENYVKLPDKFITYRFRLKISIELFNRFTDDIGGRYDILSYSNSNCRVILKDKFNPIFEKINYRLYLAFCFN